ncbi:DNA polymerase III subunit beta [Patescibacteria group bacterium]|jgi:DNA polymerase-3 subunit beta|nr:DNA polymerase III subunit beta [Patescibacteria group bacterium]
MNFACTQENLLQGLSLVSHISGKNANLPILGNVLLKTENGGLKLSTTNLEMAVSAMVRGRVEQAGEFTVPAKLLQDYISLLPAGKVELVLNGDGLEVRADGSTTTVRGMPSSEFPLIPRLTKEGGYRLKAEELRGAIGQVAFAVSGSESRPELGGVACYFNGEHSGKLVMAATDSYRLAERVTGLETGSSEAEVKCIVPAKAMQEIGRILTAYSDDMGLPEAVEWAMTDSQMVITYGNVELISRLIEASFPDYRQIIPTQFKTTGTITRTELAKAIRAASLFSRQGLFDVHFEFSEGSLKVSSSDTGTGAHATSLKAVVDGDANKVTMNYRYISDGLAAIGKDKVTIRLIDGMNAVVVTPAEGEGYRYIVMPIRQ